MRLLRSSAVALVLALGAAPAFVAPAAHAQISIGISVNFAPPPLPIYDQPPIPGPDYIWTPGYWAWDDDYGDYYWVPGTWAAPPQPGLFWTPAWWGWDSGVYQFHGGYWGPQVGFYGGVAYGFGYGGNGYEGGYWRQNHFFYNRSVNNITNVHITNIYNKTVINNRSAVSFNGPGGVNARPTPQQVAMERQHHVPPTALQTQHIREAAAQPALRASANHGAPPVAATAKPGAFSGAGVVKAARPGGAYHPPPAMVQRQAQLRASHGESASPGAPRNGARPQEPTAPRRSEGAAAPTETRPATPTPPQHERALPETPKAPAEQRRPEAAGPPDNTRPMEDRTPAQRDQTPPAAMPDRTSPMREPGAQSPMAGRPNGPAQDRAMPDRERPAAMGGPDRANVRPVSPPEQTRPAQPMGGPRPAATERPVPPREPPPKPADDKRNQN